MPGVRRLAEPIFRYAAKAAIKNGHLGELTSPISGDSNNNLSKNSDLIQVRRRGLFQICAINLNN